MPYCWIILVQGFCPLKIEIIQFPDGFHLNTIKQVFSTIETDRTQAQVKRRTRVLCPAPENER